MDTTGYNNGSPAPISLPVIEYLTGMHAAGAVLAALHAVQQNRPGQSIDMALYDAGFAAMSSFLTRNLADGDSVRPACDLRPASRACRLVAIVGRSPIRGGLEGEPLRSCKALAAGVGN